MLNSFRLSRATLVTARAAVKGRKNARLNPEANASLHLYLLCFYLPFIFVPPFSAFLAFLNFFNLLALETLTPTTAQPRVGPLIILVESCFFLLHESPVLG